MIRAGVYGATGYAGFELLRILRHHPGAEVRFATSRSHAGANLSDIFPVRWDLPLIPEADADPGQVDAVFCCLPAGAALTTVAAARTAGTKVVDLSADFRLKDPQVYRQWYGLEHTAPDLLPSAVYGLPEIARAEISRADLVANPGCYPTSILLALYPLLKAGLVTDGPIIADSKSGVSGAGRTPSLKTHFVEANENLSPYSIGRGHRHLPEMEQEMEILGAKGISLLFAPHLVPMDRGILSTIYVSVPARLSMLTLHKVFSDIYANEPFIWLLPEGQLASIAHAVGTNRCVVSLTLPAPGQLIVCSAIDNLVKGAAGQAVQNLNLMFDLEESMGLSNS